MEFHGIPWKKSTRTSFIEGDPESSSYIVGGTKAFLSKCSLTKPNYISTFHLMVIFYGILYVFISYGTERIFPFDEFYMFLFHAETNAFPIA